VTTLDAILAKAMQLSGAPILFVGTGTFCGPGPGVLLVHPEGEGHDHTWTLPTDVGEVRADIDLGEPMPFGDFLVARCGTQFRPSLTKKHDAFVWDGCNCIDDWGYSIESSALEMIKQFAATQGDLTGDLKMDSRKDFLDAQAAAEPTYRVSGDSAPPPMHGESLPDYEGRLVRPHQPHCSRFKDADLAKVGCPVTRRVLAAQIYSDAAAALRSGADVPAGQLRAIKERDQSGREITRYVSSDDGACWDRFNAPFRYITKFMVPGSVR
jgi:hypothetical protein